MYTSQTHVPRHADSVVVLDRRMVYELSALRESPGPASSGYLRGTSTTFVRTNTLFRLSVICLRASDRQHAKDMGATGGEDDEGRHKRAALFAAAPLR